MNTISKTLNMGLIQIVLEAEKAVREIADADLKKIAFDRVLEHLLQNSLPKPVEDNKKPKASKTKTEKISSSKPGPKAWIRELVDDGFFKDPKTNSLIRAALDERGHILNASDLTQPLASLVDEKFLRRKKMPAEEGGKEQIHWHNW